MPKKIVKQVSKRHKSDPIVPVLADKYGLNPRYIRMVRDGERSNDAVFSDYMTLREWWDAGVKNLLLGEVEKLVPFQNN